MSPARHRTTLIPQEIETGEQLRQWRKEQFLTQTQLASLLGVHINTIAKWEAGIHRLPGSATLALEQITGQRARLVARLHRVKERLAYERNMKAIRQGKYTPRGAR